MISAPRDKLLSEAGVLGSLYPTTILRGGELSIIKNLTPYPADTPE